MFAEEDLRPISALQHLLFCERQCALIHVEQLWAENVLTITGRQLHEKADAGRATRKRGRPAVTRGLPLRSLRLGLFGKADVVEFHDAAQAREVVGAHDATTVAAPDVSTTSTGGATSVALSSPVSPTPSSPLSSSPSSSPPRTPFPVEYKRGQPKKNRCDEVQLCAQALCLEEMLDVAVPAGAIFYGITRRRTDVAFDETLRSLTTQTITRLHAMLAAGVTPRAKREKKCERCSLLHLCLPDVLEGREPASRYLRRTIDGVLHETKATAE